MKKLIILIWFFWLSLLLNWCTKDKESQIVFENYNILLKTPSLYKEINPSENLKQTNPNIIKYYLSENNSWFQSSLLIWKQEISAEMTLEQFAKKIKNIEQNKISNKEFTDEKIIKTECWIWFSWTYLSTLEITNNKDILYMNQSLFIDKWFWYIISTMTDNKKENKAIISSLKSLSCKF